MSTGLRGFTTLRTEPRAELLASPEPAKCVICGHAVSNWRRRRGLETCFLCEDEGRKPTPRDNAPDQAAAVVLAMHQQGLGPTEIAKATGRTVSAVKWILKRYGGES